MVNRSGIQSRGDVLVNETADGVDLNVIFDELSDALEEYNKHRSAIVNLLSYPTTDAGDAVPQDVNAELFEEATEYGTPRGIADPSYLKLGYNFRDWDLGLRMSWKYLRGATREQVDNRIARAFEADNRLTTGVILDRLFSPVVRTNEFGIPCYGLYSGDMKPPDHMGRSFPADHTHYLRTESLTLDSQDVELGIRHIAEHGYGSTQSARFLLLMNPNDVVSSKITCWRAGKEYATGKVPEFDFIPSSNAPARITNEVVVGATPPPEYNNLPVTGSYGKALLIESYFIPAGWVAIVATGGNRSDNNPVGFREHDKPQYRGLRLIPGPGPYPITESFMQRGFGVGVRHRGAAVAIQITTNPSYTPPVIVAHR